MELAPCGLINGEAPIHPQIYICSELVHSAAARALLLAALAPPAPAAAAAGGAGSLSVPVFVEHATLVRTMLDYVLPRHFRTPLSAAERAEILHVTKHYSKDRGGGRKWKSDSAAKREDASAQLKSAAAKVLLPFYAKLKRRVPRLDPA